MEVFGKKLDECFQFIEKNISNGNVLVNCQQGVSRSASVVIMYLMRKFNVGYYEGFRFVKRKRNIIKINPSF
jgi:protein-tyrosine phosphatase